LITIKIFKKPILYLVCILISLIIIAGCSKGELDIPEYQPITEPPPVEITIERLFDDYVADKTAADIRYKNERFLIYEVEVERVGGEWVYIGLGEWVFEKTHFISGSVKFYLSGEDYGIMQNIEEGYVLNVVGECVGLTASPYDKTPFILFHDCWVESVVGDLGTGVYEDPY
jgi:hypothetical protein